MSLTTFSAFYYGHEITLSNYQLNFDEGGSELTAELNVGAYTLEEFAEEIKRAMDAAGALTYTVVVSRATRIITISAGSNFTLLSNTGSQASNSPWSIMGFSTAADKTGADTYDGDSGSGSQYLPQFILQDHVATINNKQAVDASVNKTAAGTIELIKFGDERFLECNIKFATDITGQDGSVIKTNASGVASLTDFMEYCITKQPIEYMANIGTKNTYQSLILESTPDSPNGTGFKLKELYDKGLAGWYETGVLKFREYDT